VAENARNVLISSLPHCLIGTTTVSAAVAQNTKARTTSLTLQTWCNNVVVTPSIVIVPCRILREADVTCVVIRQKLSLESGVISSLRTLKDDLNANGGVDSWNPKRAVAPVLPGLLLLASMENVD
jgi:hypothetical protein